MKSNFYVAALSYKLIPLYLHTYEYIQKCKALKEYRDNEMRSQLDTTDIGCSFKLDLANHNALEVIQGLFLVC